MIQFSFGGNNLPQYTIELYVGNTLVGQNVVTPMALEMLAMQFAQLCEQIANEKRTNEMHLQRYNRDRTA